MLDKEFLANQKTAQLAMKNGGIMAYSVGHNREIGRYIDVMIDGAWCPYPWWQEFHEEYFENSSGF
jgi:hypothetical protein